MNLRNILQSFNSPKLRYGGYAALLSGIVIALLVALNVAVDQIPGARADLTEEKLFTLSEQTLKTLDELDQDIVVHTLFETGKEIDFVGEILDKYKLGSRRISTRNVDPYRNPGFLGNYKEEDREPGANSLIVEAAGSGRFRVISQYDFFNYSAPRDNDPFGQRQAQSIKVEQKLTGAIMALSAAKQPTIYVLQGHEEKSLPFELRTQLREENYKVEDLNLLTAQVVPEDGDILLVIAPSRDLSDQEEEKIRGFLLERRRHALFFFDLRTDKSPLANFDKILKTYGVAIDPVLIVERDASLHVPQIPIGLVPEMGFHPITSALRTGDLAVLWPRAQAVVQQEVKRRTVKTEPVLSTSAKAWGKVDLTSQSFEQGLDDRAGPFDLAVAITDEGEREADDSRVVVAGSSFVLYPERAFGLPLTGPGNADFVLNDVNWLQGQQELISIRPKSLIQFPLRINQVQFFLFAGIAVILIPLLILGLGLVIWLRRRHL